MLSLDSSKQNKTSAKSTKPLNFLLSLQCILLLNLVCLNVAQMYGFWVFESHNYFCVELGTGVPNSTVAFFVRIQGC